MKLIVKGAALAEPIEFEIENEDELDWEDMPFLSGSQAIDLVTAWMEKPDTIRDYESPEDMHILIVAEYRPTAGLNITWWSESADADGMYSVADAPFDIEQEVVA